MTYMSSESQRRARRELSAALSHLNIIIPKHGWLRTIRDSLGMTTKQFAARLGVSQPGAFKMEQREADGTITLNSLREAAAALNCSVVYALVPNADLEHMVQQQARKIAARRLGRVSQTMRLEAQQLPPQKDEMQLQELAEEIIRTKPRALWADK